VGVNHVDVEIPKSLVEWIKLGDLLDLGGGELPCSRGGRKLLWTLPSREGLRPWRSLQSVFKGKNTEIKVASRDVAGLVRSNTQESKIGNGAYCRYKNHKNGKRNLFNRSISTRRCPEGSGRKQEHCLSEDSGLWGSAERLSRAYGTK